MRFGLIYPSKYLFLPVYAHRQLYSSWLNNKQNKLDLIKSVFSLKFVASMKLNGQRKQRKGRSSLLYAVYFFFTSRTSLWETTSCVLFCITAHSIKTQSTLDLQKYAGVTGIETSLWNTWAQLVSAVALRRCRVGCLHVSLCVRKMLEKNKRRTARSGGKCLCFCVYVMV